MRITMIDQARAILSARRKQLRMTQAELASRMGLSQNRVSVLESDPSTMSFKQLHSLLAALGLEMSISEKKPLKSSAE